MPYLTAERLPSQAAVLLTHRLTPRILRHFERLRAELADLFPVFLCFHQTSATLSAVPLACSEEAVDIHLTTQDGAKWLPRRHVQYVDRRVAYLGGFTDLLLVPIVLDKRLDAFDYIWIVEFDVDFSGHWAEFFRWSGRSKADLLSPVITRRSQDKGWPHWESIRTPVRLTAQDQIRGFFPLLRIARKTAAAYVDELDQHDWHGWHEGLMPTIAARQGFSLASMRPSRQFRDPILDDGVSQPNATTLLHPATFVFRPILSAEYFHENPDGFPIANSLYHPVKPGDPEFFGAIQHNGRTEESRG